MMALIGMAMLVGGIISILSGSWIVGILLIILATGTGDDDEFPD